MTLQKAFTKVSNLKSSGISGIDFSNAFDLVDYKTLLRQLLEIAGMTLGPELIKCILNSSHTSPHSKLCKPAESCNSRHSIPFSALGQIISLFLNNLLNTTCVGK